VSYFTVARNNAAPRIRTQREKVKESLARHGWVWNDRGRLEKAEPDEPEPEKKTTPMKTQQPNWDDWNRWCEAHIRRALKAQKKPDVEALGWMFAPAHEVVRQYVEQRVEALLVELDALRAKNGLAPLDRTRRRHPAVGEAPNGPRDGRRRRTRRACREGLGYKRRDVYPPKETVTPLGTSLKLERMADWIAFPRVDDNFLESSWIAPRIMKSV
jgi:hypothetical protein